MQRRFLWTLLISSVCLVAAHASSDAAEEIFVCGASEGLSFFPKVGLAADSSDAGKWVEDKITNGRITLSKLADGKFDLLYADATGGVFSAIQAGSHVVPLASNEFASTFLMYNSLGAVEAYTFVTEMDGTRYVLWSTHKTGQIITKIGVYKADCR